MTILVHFRNRCFVRRCRGKSPLYKGSLRHQSWNIIVCANKVPQYSGAYSNGSTFGWPTEAFFAVAAHRISPLVLTNYRRILLGGPFMAEICEVLSKHDIRHIRRNNYISRLAAFAFIANVKRGPLAIFPGHQQAPAKHVEIDFLQCATSDCGHQTE